ncbi:MAG: HAD-IIB family hydrolase [Cyanobacteria bacterium Co-bin13]|nr:HAD-IIB family hydrolase [Cyanobacteria bacterium Co-bin13]
MTGKTSLLIFTDLDGTLLSSEDYAYAAAVPMLQRLVAEGIPVVPVTSKTRQEVETLRQRVGLRDPFVVENGSAVFIPREQRQFPLPQGDDADGYRVLQLGCTYVVARAALKAIAQELGRPLKGFGDWTVEQVEQTTGLPHADAQQAKAREFSEPFMTPKNVEPEALVAVVEDFGFRVVVGDRFSHLIGGEAGKGAAVRRLTELYQAGLPADSPVTTVGLGNSPNDLDMLEAVDIPIVLPGQNGPHAKLADRGWQIAAAPAPDGWALALEQVLAQAGY